MANELQGKVAWITGASGAIGKSIAVALAREGAQLVLSSRKAASLEAVAADIQKLNGAIAEVMVVDVTNREQVDAAALKISERFGRIDLLINSTSLSIFGDFQKLTDEDWLAVYQGKVFAYLRTIRAVLPFMMAQGDGRIVNLSGRGGHQPTLPVHLPGMTANAAVNLMTKGLANMYGAHGIRINAVAPGPVESPRYDAIMNVSKNSSDAGDHSKTSSFNTTPVLGARAHPDEIADVVVFLLSDRSRLMTGTILQADGGSTAAL